jgi:hypothetical protein
MDIASKKLELMDCVLRLDEAGLTALINLKNEIDGNIVAHDGNGNPLTLEQYRAKADRGLKDCEEGRFMTDDEL